MTEYRCRRQNKKEQQCRREYVKLLEAKNHRKAVLTCTERSESRIPSLLRVVDTSIPVSGLISPPPPSDLSAIRRNPMGRNICQCSRVIACTRTLFVECTVNAIQEQLCSNIILIVSIRSFTVMAPVRQKIRELCERKSSKLLDLKLRQITWEINQSCSSVRCVHIIFYSSQDTLFWYCIHTYILVHVATPTKSQNAPNVLRFHSVIPVIHIISVIPVIPDILTSVSSLVIPVILVIHVVCVILSHSGHSSHSSRLCHPQSFRSFWSFLSSVSSPVIPVILVIPVVCVIPSHSGHSGHSCRLCYPQSFRSFWSFVSSVSSPVIPVILVIHVVCVIPSHSGHSGHSYRLCHPQSFRSFLSSPSSVIPANTVWGFATVLSVLAKSDKSIFLSVLNILTIVHRWCVVYDMCIFPSVLRMLASPGLESWGDLA